MTTGIVTGIIAGVLGICLLGVIAALIFNPNFRSDLAANPGKVSLFGASIEGVVIVLITGALITSVVMCARYIIDLEKQRITSKEHELSIRLTQLPIEVVVSNDVTATIDKIIEMTKLAQQANKSVDIVSLVEELTYDKKESETIRTFPLENVGPWSLGGEAYEYLLSVPDKISEGKANWCPENINYHYEVRSRLKDPTIGEAEIIKITNPITVAKNCSETYDYLQVTCKVASKVFGESIVTCDSKGKPLWHFRPNKKIPIWVTPVPKPTVNKPNKSSQAGG